MDADLKKILKAVVLAMRHSLEGKYNEAGIWQPGDLESRLAEIGVRQDRESVPAEEMPSLTLEDQQARRVVDGYLKLRQEAGVLRGEAVREFVRESAYTWANRLLALRCMEARELIDEAILQKSTYGGRSLEHHRLIQRNPELSETPDDGRFAMLNKVFTEQAKRLPNLFDPSSPSIALRPSPAALKQSLDWLSGSLAVRSQPAATDEVFQAPDALGWAYQYWNTDEKKRVFDMVKTVKGAKIAGADIEAWRSDEPTKWGDWLAEQPMFDQISSLDDRRPPPKTIAEFVAQESMYVPNFNDGVRVNIAPLQKAGILAADVLAPKDVDKAIADRAEWRADERRWVRKGILPRPGWWPERDEQTIEVAE